MKSAKGQLPCKRDGGNRRVFNELRRIRITLILQMRRIKNMVNKRYYEKLGGFSYLLGELRKKIGGQQTDILIDDAVNLCNQLCDK